MAAPIIRATCTLGRLSTVSSAGAGRLGSRGEWPCGIGGTVLRADLPNEVAASATLAATVVQPATDPILAQRPLSRSDETQNLPGWKLLSPAVSSWHRSGTCRRSSPPGNHRRLGCHYVGDIFTWVLPLQRPWPVSRRRTLDFRCARADLAARNIATRHRRHVGPCLLCVSSVASICLPRNRSDNDTTADKLQYRPPFRLSSSQVSRRSHVRKLLVTSRPLVRRWRNRRLNRC